MDESNLPYISIIIPTYRRPERLTVCLKSIARLDYPQDRFEVIVVDDGSPTPLETLAVDFHECFNFMLLKQAHSGPATARNTGAAQAKGEILAFTDDDCEPAVDWLQTLSKRYTATPGCAIGGRTLNKLPDNPFSTASQILIDYLYTYYNADPLQARFLASNNIALPSDRFHKIGGFDTTFPLAAGEDRELCERWLNHGFQMIYASEVLVWHSHSLTYGNFWNQHFNYGRGAFYFQQVRAHNGYKRSRMEPLSFYLNLMRAPFKLIKSDRAPLLAALLFLTQCANAAGYFASVGGESLRSFSK
jgi:glycosyltransferase involved in cell wall biosynthesis